ncbi:hypothetical protein PQG22_09970 [Aquirufa beregesia]|uniref:hypothetical protein n=1 Tax=Aquirufa beregesia TaxID=2516556 RepID=UPI001409F0E6|nr:hypothetical protein [Aquirufa beregesia]
MTSSEEGKETWTKPELEIVSLKENTLAAAAVGADLGLFSLVFQRSDTINLF